MTESSTEGASGSFARSAFVRWVVRIVQALSSVALAVLLVATFTSVIMRYVFGAPILGSNEVIQLASVALVMLAMPAAAHGQDHIRVDVFDGFIGRIGRFTGDLLSRGIAVYLLSVLARRAMSKLFDAAEYGDATNMLAIPLWPFYGLVALGAVLYAFVLVIQFIDILGAGVSGNE